MQALSIWPSKIDFRVVPKLDMGVSRVGSYCILSTRRKRWDFGDYGCHCRRSDLIPVSSCLRGRKIGTCLGSSQLDIKYGVFDGCSRFQVYFFSEPKEGRVQKTVALALTREGQTIGNGNCDNIAVIMALALTIEEQTIGRVQKAVGEDSVSLDGVSGKNGNCDTVDENGSENEELDRSVKEKGSENKKVGEEKKKERIDVRLLGGSLRLARTVEDVEEVLKDKGELPLQVYSTIIRAFGNEKRLEAAMALVQWLKEKKKRSKSSSGPNIFIYNSLLGAMRDCEQFEQVENVVNEMATEGVIPNVVTFNTLMGISKRKGKEAEVLNLFEEMQKKGLSPSPANCSTALVAYRRMEDGFGVLKFYVELREKYRNGYIGKDREDWETEFSKLEDFTVRLCYQVMRGWLVKNENLNTSVLKLLVEMDRVGLPTGRSAYERLMRACTREEHYIVAKELYKRIRERDSKISLSVCNHVIWLMGKAKEWWAALEIYEDLLDKGPEPNCMSNDLVVSHFNILLTATRKRGLWEWGVRLLNKMEEKGLKPGSKVWNAVLVACSKASETSAAIQIFIRMVEQGEKPTVVSYCELLSALEKGQHYVEAQQVLRPNRCYQVMRGWLVKSGNFTNVLNLLTEMDRVGIFIRQGKEVDALNLFEEIQNKGLSPSPWSYSTALLDYRRVEDGFGALKFYVALREKYRSGYIGKDREDWEIEFSGLEYFTVQICYQVMRGWLVKSRNFTNVLKLLTEMDRVGLPIGRSEYEHLMWACTSEEHYFVAKELYRRIRKRHSEISLSVCNHLIWFMGQAKKWWAALEIYEDLLDKGPEPNSMSSELLVSHFNIQLTEARKKGLWKYGVRLLNKMEEKGLKPGSAQWDAVLVACSKASETYAAFQIFKRMVEQGEKPTVVSYGSLLGALEKGKLYDEAQQVWGNMIKVGVQPNVYAYTIMASIYTAQGKINTVDSIIHEMSISGIEITVVTYNAIISACARNNMSGTAYEWFHKMEAQSISLNKVTYEMLIEALTNDGKPKLAYDLYLRAQNEGLNLSSKAYDSVIHSSEIYGATIDVDILGPRPPPARKKIVPIRKNLSEFCNLPDVPRRSSENNFTLDK
ncbi:hypothetical protein Vadar_010419 [Vaccinium darrowii]|uniref:Uncharacterized protein n=1 Tax=Vaccinium darrowii TaxID=229202 RepID=A0ACB7XYR5_9ERIC|nr:hypothetical protein Vadar_010419 [Vaccinium darrowii]